MEPHVYDGSQLSRSERVDALHASGLLRHDMQNRMDILCETATLILKTPMSMVNVLDATNVTTVGKWPPDDADRVAPIDVVACKYVVASREPVVIPNTLLHPVVCFMPVVTVQGVRSYLGVPIFYNGEAIGSVCVADFEVREWTRWDVATLEGLSRLAGLAVADDDS